MAPGQELCKDCATLSQTVSQMIAIDNDDPGWVRDPRKIAESARRGCGLCLMILQGVPLDLEGDLNLFAISAFGDDRGYGSSLYGISKIHVTQENLQSFGTLHVYTYDDDPAARYSRQRPLYPDLSNLEGLGAARKWLRDCLYHHTKLSGPQIPALPSRVLDVSLADPDSVRLHEGTVGEIAMYATLSYCWGGTPHFVTDKSNFSEHLKQIRVESLPQSIKDAVFCTRALEIRFLWIDALCIIQDSEVDKDKEIEKMGTIYKNATVAFEACKSSGVSQGFLSKKHPPSTVKLPVLCPNGEHGTIWIVRETRPKQVFNNGPLDLRAWTLQEDLLSSRILRFGEHTMAWACPHTINRSEHEDPQMIGPRLRLPDSFYDQQGTPLEKSLRASIDDGEWSKKPESLWYRIIQESTSRQLSFQSDRLPAVAGIATELQSIWKDQYFAGLWKQHIIAHMAWFSDNHHEVNEEEAGYFISAKDESRDGPTWSWASVPGIVHLHGPEGKKFTKFVDCSINPLNKSLFGRIRSGRLVVRGPLIKAKLPFEFSDDKRRKVKWSLDLHLDGEGITRDWDRLARVEERLWMLLVGCVPSERKSHYARVCGILLVQTSFNDDGSYRRVGGFTINGYCYPGELNPSCIWPAEFNVSNKKITIV